VEENHPLLISYCLIALVTGATSIIALWPWLGVVSLLAASVIASAAAGAAAVFLAVRAGALRSAAQGVEDLEASLGEEVLAGG
jgi:hypothetical protein